MKKVLFICLLSLATCLSRPDGAPNAAPQTPPAVPAPAGSPAPAALAQLPADATPAKETTASTTTIAPPPPAAPSTEKAPSVPANAVPPAQANPPANPPAPAHVDDKPENVDPKKTDKKEPDSPAAITTTVKPTVDNNTKNDNKSDAQNKTNTPLVPEDKNEKKNASTTAKPEVPTNAAPAKPVEAAGRGFDGPSFLGGMILTLGLLAIGFMGFKYYRNQTERNYHTL